MSKNCNLAANLRQYHAREADSEDGVVGEYDSIEFVVLTAYLLELIDEVHDVRLRPEREISEDQHIQHEFCLAFHL